MHLGHLSILDISFRSIDKATNSRKDQFNIILAFCFKQRSNFTILKKQLDCDDDTQRRKSMQSNDKDESCFIAPNTDFVASEIEVRTLSGASFINYSPCMATMTLQIGGDTSVQSFQYTQMEVSMGLRSEYAIGTREERFLENLHTVHKRRPL